MSELGSFVREIRRSSPYISITHHPPSVGVRSRANDPFTHNPHRFHPPSIDLRSLASSPTKHPRHPCHRRHPFPRSPHAIASLKPLPSPHKKPSTDLVLVLSELRRRSFPMILSGITSSGIRATTLVPQSLGVRIVVPRSDFSFVQKLFEFPWINPCFISFSALYLYTQSI